MDIAAIEATHLLEAWLPIAVVFLGKVFTIDQVAIFFTGVTAIWLSQDPREDHRRWACILGLVGQPFWFYMAWSTEKMGVFLLCFLYTLSWWRGFRHFWLNRWRRM